MRVFIAPSHRLCLNNILIHAMVVNMTNMFLTEEAYRKSPELNYSTLKLAAEDKRLLMHFMEGTYKPYSDAMSFGRAIHTHVLQGEAEFNKHYYTQTARKGSKAFTEECEKNEGKQPLTETVMSKVKDMASIFDKSKQELYKCGALCAESTTEVCLFAEYDKTKYKCRVDILTPCEDSSLLLVDYKTVGDLVPQAKHGYRIRDYRYNMQSAMYRKITELSTGKHISGCMHILQSTREPYLIDVYVINDEVIREGEAEWMAAKEIYDEAMSCTYSDNTSNNYCVAI